MTYHFRERFCIQELHWHCVDQARFAENDDCKVIMEIKEQTTDIPLSLANSIRILPHTIAVAVVECATPLNSTMDIRADEGFLRDFPNIHVE